MAPYWTPPSRPLPVTQPNFLAPPTHTQPQVHTTGVTHFRLHHKVLQHTANGSKTSGPLSSINAQAGSATMSFLPSHSGHEGEPASAASALCPQPCHPTPASLLPFGPLPPSLIFPQHSALPQGLCTSLMPCVWVGVGEQQAGACGSSRVR